MKNEFYHYTIFNGNNDAILEDDICPTLSLCITKLTNQIIFCQSAYNCDNIHVEIIKEKFDMETGSHKAIVRHRCFEYNRFFNIISRQTDRYNLWKDLNDRFNW